MFEQPGRDWSRKLNPAASFRSAGQLSLPTELVVPLGFVKDWSVLLTEIFCFQNGLQNIVSDN